MLIPSVLLAFSIALWIGVTQIPIFKLVPKSSIKVDEIDWMRGFIDSVRSGVTAREALSFSNLDLVPNAASKLTQPTELAAALTQDARNQNSLLLKALAACWHVSQQHGAPLAPALQSALDAQLDRIAVAEEIKSQLAGPKTAAITLALLPIATLLLAQSLGISAFAWLISSPVGLVVLVIGVTFLSIGTAVMFKLAGNIEQELQM